jgi:hypothetical protein
VANRLGDTTRRAGNFVLEVEGEGNTSFPAHPGEPIPRLPETNIPRAALEQQLAEQFSGARARELLSATPRTADGNTPVFYRTVSRAEAEQLVREGRIASRGLDTDVAALPRATRDEIIASLQQNGVTGEQIRRILDPSISGPERVDRLIEAFQGRTDVLFDAHNDPAAFAALLSPFKGASLGPHYEPTTGAGDYVVKIVDRYGRAVRNRAGDYEGEFLFRGEIRADEVLEVLTPAQFNAEVATAGGIGRIQNARGGT